jgi:hypothetical protein
VPLGSQQELHSRGFLGVPTGKNPEESVEVMQWIFLYLSSVNDRSYWEDY